ncbi:diguanylate cyclase [Rippkaea orientalis PCC 8801]|uniref:Diguanylate cyclase n=1 Tax=Rippkaea orientalis (strain PCC 8801 / RF-1) TaxID=41431 RepID=B7JVP4_RIPO1|nr:diguanylate cyclase [Rippkaea orientalis PCC 8801]
MTANDLLSRLVKALSSCSKSVILALALILVILIGVIDYWIKVDLSLSIFYLFPIILVTWFINQAMGFSFCCLCTFIWLIADSAAKIYPYPLLPYWNASVRLGFFSIITYLISQIKNAYEREKILARTDSLTGAFNNRFFREILQIEINRCYRYQHPLTLAYFDVDNFKQVNDQLGYSSGDHLLQLITQIIQKNIRQTDTLARLGGDEFALLLPETDYNQGQIVLRRVQEELLLTIESEKVPIGFSIGALTHNIAPESVDKALEKVDSLMYTVKKQGKNGLKHEII